MDNRLCSLVILLFLLTASLGLQAQIPESRVMDWSKAGVTGGIPTGWEEIKATDHGIVADGKTDNTTAINNLLKDAVSFNKAIKFPSGTIRCEGKLDFPVEGHRIIRGTLSATGEKLTKFIFNTGTIGGNTGNFNVENGKNIGGEIVVSGGYTKGSRQLTLAATTGINVGDYIELRQDNDMSIMDSYHNINVDDVWYARNIGQLFQVTAVNTSSKVITLSRSLRFTYKSNFNPKIQEIQVTEKVGFEDFYTENLRTGNKCNFYFEMAADCWIKNVHSYKTVTAHVNIIQSLNVTVRESFFDHSWEHGDGGKGYGVVAGSRTVDCLIENNEFTRLRHAMMTKQASNGNVFGYNYSHDHINIYKATNPTVDISIHGHYSYMNLFEGNSVEWIHSADWWGPTGPGTTFFRNKVVWWDIYLDDNSQDQNVVGNVLSNAEKKIRVHNSVKNTFLHGNEEGGTVSWDANSGTNNVKVSYYLKSKPSFLKEEDPWPLYGPKPADDTEEPENALPVISLKSTESITLPATSVTLTGSATDADGTIASYGWTKVSGGTITMEGSATASLVLKDLAEGTYKFKLTATDNGGAAASKEITLTVLPVPNVLPAVSITSPANNAKVEAGTAVSITADATDEDGSLAKVEFYVAGAKIGEDTESPFSYSLTPEKPGEYVLTVKATDNSGGNTSSAAVKLIVEATEEEPENVPPVISLEEEEEITLPADEVTLAAAASDEDGTVESYEWTKVSGPPAEISGTTSASLVVGRPEEGIYVFRLAVTDNKGAVTLKETKLIVYPVPNKMPSVSLTSPVLNAVFFLGNDVEIQASASDPDGTVSLVEFFNGTVKLGEDASAPYSYTWKPSETGGYTLLAKVTDNKGAISFSNTGFVKIEEAPEPENVAPVIELKESETLSLPLTEITLTATATDHDGTIASYEWTKVSGGSVSMSGISAPSLKLEKLSEGTYEFKLTVTDEDGATASKNVRVEVLPDPNLRPLISIKSPIANAVFELGDTVEISATASDEDGTISRVIFFAGFVKLGEVTQAPYNFIWIPTGTGTYSVTAKAYDDAGASALSEAVIVTVQEAEGEQAPPEEEKPEEPVTEYEGEGTILREFFDNISGTAIADIPLEEAPTSSDLLQSLEGPVNAGQNYGSRIRGYVHPPVSGAYTFWITGDDHAALYLSSDENPENKELVAQAAGNKILRQWNKDESQQSVALTLEGGKKYYIEVLHKEENGGDHVAVGWQLANGTYERPIPGNRLSPYVSPGVLAVKPDADQQGSLRLYPNPAEDRLFLELKDGATGEADWTILDMQGKVYSHQEVNLTTGFSGAQEIDISGLNLPPGLYMVQVRNRDGNMTAKFIKK